MGVKNTGGAFRVQRLGMDVVVEETIAQPTVGVFVEDGGGFGMTTQKLGDAQRFVGTERVSRHVQTGFSEDVLVGRILRSARIFVEQREKLLNEDRSCCTATVQSSY